MRWMEWGVFCGVFRTHGTRPGNEPWSFGTQVRYKIEALIRLRYRLLPYLYSAAFSCALHGEPLIRPMEDEGWTHQFYFGPSLLIAPVTQQGARSQRVLLPEGNWRSWWTGERLTSGVQTVAAPLGKIPVFVREGSVIPIFDKLGVNAAACGDLTMLVVPGGDGGCDYYDDDGETWDYEQGAYQQVRFTYQSGKLSAEPVHGPIPEYRVDIMEEQDSPCFDADCSWQGDTAWVTAVFLKPCEAEATLIPEPGWQIVACSSDHRTDEIYEPAYFPKWSGRVLGNIGDTVRWELRHTSAWKRIGEQSAKLCCGEETFCLHWDGPYLSDPWLLGCFPPEGPKKTPAPKENPEAYRFDWRKDPLFARNPYGYVDFRRLDPQRNGEAMLGVAYAKENIYSKAAVSFSFLLRYDSPITLWVNGKKAFKGIRANEPGILIPIKLDAGNNQLILRQNANVARPYSGSEFGYSLEYIGDCELFEQK